MTIRFRLTMTGTRPLIMASNAKVDPFHPIAREMKVITSKRKKTDDDMLDLYRLEWTACMYYDPDLGPYLPSDNISRCILDAARKSKLGVRVQEGVFIDSDVNPIAYPGPRTLDEMWEVEDHKFIKPVKNMGRTTVMRCRPIFREWKADCTGILDPNRLDFAELKRLADDAGTLVGLCDWRPRYGRFGAVVEEIKS